MDGEETENEVDTSQNLRSQLLRGGSSDSEYSSKNWNSYFPRYIRYEFVVYPFFCFFADLDCIPDSRCGRHTHVWP